MLRGTAFALFRLGLSLGLGFLVLVPLATAQEAPPAAPAGDQPGNPTDDTTRSSSGWREVFRLSAPVVSEGALPNATYGFQPLLRPMVDTEGKPFRIMTHINITPFSGLEKYAGGGLFVGNALPDNNSNFSRAVWYNSEKEGAGPRGWYLRQYYGNGGVADLITVSEQDTQDVILDLRFDAGGKSGTAAFAGNPAELRTPFQLPVSVLNNNKVASAVESGKYSRVLVDSYTLYLRD